MPQHLDALSPYELMLLYRSDAIGAYGAFEQALSRCFIAVTKTEPRVGSLIFFNIVATRTRLSIIESLLKEKYYPAQRPFWVSALKLIRKIDDTRNQIVHWLPISELPVDKNGVASLNSRKSPETWLRPPDYWKFAEGSGELSINDVLAFRHKTTFVAKNLDLWHIHVTGSLPDVTKPFEHRFQQSIPYPPPEDHPLFERLPVWRNPRRSSPS
ncbi:MAG: hypothetical protein ABL957_05560 [Parvularculaceae bacterium]